jgi:MFS family permease
VSPAKYLTKASTDQVAPSVFSVTPDVSTRADSLRSDSISRRTWLSLIFVALASMVAQGFGRFTFPVLLKAIENEMLGSYTLAGLLSNVPLVAYLIGTAIVSVASTRIEAARLVKVGVSMSFVGLALMAFAPNVWFLCLGLFVAGFGAAAVWVPAPGIAAALVGAKRGGMAIGLVGILVAGPLTNSVRAVTQDEGAWRPVYAIQAGIAIFVLIGLFAVLRAGAKSEVTEKVAISVLTTVPNWKWILASFAVFGIAYSLYFYFLPTQLLSNGWSAQSSTLVFSLLGLSSIFGGVVFGRISDRYSRRLTMGFGFLLMSTAPILSLSEIKPLVIVGAISFGLCVAGVPTTIGAMLSDSLSGRSFATAFGTITLGFGIAQLIGPPFAGWVGDQTGSFAIPFMVASALAVVAASFAIWMKPVGKELS